MELLENAPCAMVPLKPNELMRDAGRGIILAASKLFSAVISAGMRNDDRRDDRTDERCTFTLRLT